MLQKLSAITPEVYNRMLLDSGLVYKNYGTGSEEILGATRGGNTVTIEPEHREMPVDGAPGPVKGSQRTLRMVAKMSVNIIEITTDTLLLAVPGSANTPNGTHDVIKVGGTIADGDYLDNITLVLRKKGTNALFGITLENALSLGSLEFAGTDDDEVKPAIEFTAHFDPEALDESPVSIFNPLESGIHTLRYIAGANGYISGKTKQVVANGEDAQLVTAVPNTGYAFDDWSDAVATPGRTDTNITASATRTANFVLGA